jgi:hypothetical protein
MWTGQRQLRSDSTVRMGSLEDPDLLDPVPRFVRHGEPDQSADRNHAFVSHQGMDRSAAGVDIDAVDGDSRGVMRNVM